MASSVARCCASAALPPLPKNKSLPPERSEPTQAASRPANASPSAASVRVITSRCSANSALKNAATSTPASSLSRFAAEIRHRVAQDAIDRGAIIAGEPALQGRKPGAHGLERRLHRFGGDDAGDADISIGLFAREQDLGEPLARTDAGKGDVDVAPRL